MQVDYNKVYVCSADKNFKNKPLKIFKQGGVCPVRQRWIRLWLSPNKQKVCVPQTKVPKIQSYFSLCWPWVWNTEQLSLQIVLDWCDESIQFACLWRNKVFVGNVDEPHWSRNFAIGLDIKASAIVNSSFLCFKHFSTLIVILQLITKMHPLFFNFF